MCKPQQRVVETSADALERNQEAFDAAVAATPGIDPFCSRSDWILPFHRSHSPELELVICHEGPAHIALVRTFDARLGWVLQSLEHAWRFACPLVGEGACELLEQLLVDLNPDGAPMACVLSGIPDGQQLEDLLLRLHRRCEVYQLDPTTRVVASLEDGLDGWLSRRSRGFRRNRRRCLTATGARGLELLRLRPGPGEVEAIYQRILAVEARSWKGIQGVGANQEPMRSFYRRVFDRLAEQGRLRVVLARLEGQDVGYIHAGEIGTHLRGFQIAFDAGLRALGVGSRVHLEMITWACADGLERYDLGMWMRYKRAWGQHLHATPNLLLVPRRRRRGR